MNDPRVKGGGGLKEVPNTTVFIESSLKKKGDNQKKKGGKPGKRAPLENDSITVG